MARVTVDEVKAIIDTDLQDSNITAYIESVSAIVDELFSGVTITDNALKEIERWMTAHAIAISKERQAKEEGAGDAYIKYTGITSIGLKSTSYGQMALSIDKTGTLMGTMGKSVSFGVIEQ